MAFIKYLVSHKSSFILAGLLAVEVVLFTSLALYPKDTTKTSASVSNIKTKTTIWGMNYHNR